MKSEFKRIFGAGTCLHIRILPARWAQDLRLIFSLDYNLNKANLDNLPCPLRGIHIPVKSGHRWIVGPLY